MDRNRLSFILVCAYTISTFIACDDPDTSFDNQQTIDNGDIENTQMNSEYFRNTISDALAENCNTHEKANDYFWDSITAVQITLKDNLSVINGTGATVNGNIVTIYAAGNYIISGELSDGQIIVNTEDENVVRLILSGINIKCSSSSPIFIKKADKAVIVLQDKTENFLTDGTAYIVNATDEDTLNATLFSKSDMTIFGNGSLNVDANYKDGIASKDGLIIKSGTITVNSADDGIRGKDYLIINGGNITLDAVGDGFKSDNDSDSTKGYIYITAGTVKISSGGDAIGAETDILIAGGEFDLKTAGGSSAKLNETLSAKGMKSVVNTIIESGTLNINSADDAIHSNGNIAVNGGVLTLSSGDDGIHADAIITINGDQINITKSYEGVEGPIITVNSGIVSIVASDDGFNASKGSGGESNDGSNLYLKGGTVYVNVSGGDGLDSNGNIDISGGTIIVHGPQSQPEVGMDYNGTCNITGGLLIISGTNSNMTQGPSTTSTQYSLKLMTTSSIAAGTLFHIQNNSGNDIVTFKPARSYCSIVFSSASIQNGEKYSVYTGGSSTGTETNGLYSDGVYTPGTQYTSFTVSCVVTNLGSSSPGPSPGR